MLVLIGMSKFRIFTRSLVVICLLLVSYQAEAIVLQPVDLPSLFVSSPTMVGDNISFLIRNNTPTHEGSDDIRYGILIQGKSGDIIKEYILGDVVFPPLENEVFIEDEFTVPSLLSEDADAFLILRNVTDTTIAVSHIDEIKAVITSGEDIPKLTDCDLLSIDDFTFKCSVEHSSSELSLLYHIYRDSAYSDAVFVGTVENFRSNKEFNIQKLVDYPRYKVIFNLIDANGLEYPNQQGVVVNNNNIGGSVIDQMSVEKDRILNSNNTLYSVLGLIILLIIALVVYSVTHGRLSKTALSIFILLLFAPASFSSAVTLLSNTDTFEALDNSSIEFIVTLDKAEYLPNEDITFNFELLDKQTLDYKKPTDSSVTAKVGSNSWEEIVSISDTSTTYDSSISGMATEGTHQISFKVPDLCGSAFGYSLFGVGFFGSDECEFTVDVVISSSGEKPTAPIISISGSCMVDQSTTFSFYSNDDQSDEIYYNINWNDEASGRVPSSGYVDSGTTQTSTFTWNSEGSVFVRAQAVDDNGYASDWGTLAINCGYMDVGSCTAKDNFYIRSVPGLARYGDTVKIFWKADEGLDSCTVKSSNGDNWQSDETRNGKTVTVEGYSEYTLTCRSACDEYQFISTSTVVHMIPIWQED